MKKTPEEKNPTNEEKEAPLENNDKKESETEEGKDYESRYQRLEEKADLLRWEREANFAIGHTQFEGAQTLIDNFGADRFLETLKRLDSETGDSKLFSVLDVVRVLEPDREKRACLYDKMVSDATERDEDFSPDETQHKHFDSEYNTENLRSSIKIYSEAMKHLDTFFARITGGSINELCGTNIHKFAVYILQDKEIEEEFKQQLTEAQGDISLLFQARAEQIEKDTEEMHSDSSKMREDLLTDIESIARELETQPEARQRRIMEDIAKIGSLNEISDEQKESAIQTILDRAKDEIAAEQKRFREEAETKTTALQEYLNRLANIRI